MSRQALTGFLRQLDERPELEESFRRTVAEASDPAAAAIGFAEDLGHRVTADDWRQLGESASRELADDQVEGVAGGGYSSSLQLLSSLARATQDSCLQIIRNLR